MSINRKFFFNQVRSSLFGESLSQPQVTGLTEILDKWESDYWNGDDRWLAYALGTAFHEVDRTMWPITERGPRSYFNKYDIQFNPKKARELGNTEKGDGYLFRGRGYVQLTGRSNYKKMSVVVGEDLTENPDIALRRDVAAKVMLFGMMAGTFTGKKLSDYFNATKEDWVNARRIINGLDKAHAIADYSKKFYAAISYTTN